MDNAVRAERNDRASSLPESRLVLSMEDEHRLMSSSAHSRPAPIDPRAASRRCANTLACANTPLAGSEVHVSSALYC
jgi:hypothetical protein